METPIIIENIIYGQPYTFQIEDDGKIRIYDKNDYLARTLEDELKEEFLYLVFKKGIKV